MVDFNQPEDILGIGIRTILNYRKDDVKFQNLLKNWNKIIVIEFNGIYAVTIEFKDGSIRIAYDEQEGYDLKVKLRSIRVMTDIAAGTYGPIRAFMTGKIRVKKVWNVFVLLKFIRLFIPALRIAGDRAVLYKNNEADIYARTE